jgi:hypothetical protein
MTGTAPALPDFMRRFRFWLVSAFIVIAVSVRALDPFPAFVVEMRSSTNATAQLFYDQGEGLHEDRSARAAVAASAEVRTLRFRLPIGKIRALRFDPLDRPGTFGIRRASLLGPFGGLIREFGAGDFASLNQIAERVDGPSETTFSTPADAFDPVLQIALSEPLDTSGSFLRRAARIAVHLLAAFLITGAAAAAARALWPYLVTIGRRLDSLAGAMSDPRFLAVDRLAVGCYLGLVGVFLVTVAAGLHGSSASLYAPKSVADGRSLHPIAGRGKPIRGDEWDYHTPAILNQVYRSAPFDVESSALGTDSVSLIANIPVRHVTTLFRPQFWGFFFLPPAYGFSFYWQCKAMLLAAGVFSLLFLLTRSSRIAAVGAAWYVWSAFMQWTYSWPSLLPEMIGAFCLTMCCLFYLSTGTRPVLLAVAAIVCAASMVNFALCAYIPHQIPLVWLGVFLCAWWLWTNWRTIFTRDHAGVRLAAAGAVLLIVGGAMWRFYLDAAPALAGIANTVYPGRRSMAGGAYLPSMLGSHFFAFWTDDKQYPLPQLFGNICECSGFIWLAPVTLFCVTRFNGEEQARRRGYWMLAVFGVLLLVWLTVPLPVALGRTLFLDKTGSGRSMHVLGFVNVALVAICLSLTRLPEAPAPRWWRAAAMGVAIFAIVLPLMRWINASVAGFLTAGQVAAIACYMTVLALAVLQNWFKTLSTALIVPHLAVFGLVNPVDRGLDVFESAPLFRFMQGRPDLLRQRWIVYSPSVPDAGFFTAVGCDVLTGLDYVPVKGLEVFDADGTYRDLLNSALYLLTVPRFDDDRAVFDMAGPNVLRLSVSPLDPRLRSLGVRYAAFASPPPISAAARLKPLSAGPVSGFWLYELP